MGSVPGSSISRKGLFSPADAANISRGSLLRLRVVQHPEAVFLAGDAFSETPPRENITPQIVQSFSTKHVI
jgi:hypothetical protein